ncbi:cysteine-rich receptor-like protein kinase 15 isoform X2 [Phragmites australis]|uniref:cysteine-rich receptor-like protein kinase 15 isoform X2 n=1 Tax=Phragmites australis TaxID=29695 RepID=UPI002D79C967|nr:cysteine-rich receptor-like protein kinase 15 isoform X2 [Phragmites australis]
MALWNALAPAATVAQLVGADAAGLISAILHAVRTARRNRKECRSLARHVMMVADLLQLVQQGSETMRRPEVRRALDGLGGVLRRAYELVESCQERGAAYGFIMAGRQAEQFRDVQGEIDSYLLVFPVVSHIDITIRLDRIYNMLLPSGHDNSQQVPEVVPGLPTSHLELDARNEGSALGGFQLESSQTITEIFEFEELQRAELLAYDLLKAAANNFSSENIIGFSDWSAIYKAHIGDGLEVAIKIYTNNTRSAASQYDNEFQVVEKLQHTNIIKLLGRCTGRGENVLVYEYMPNGSLDKIIFDVTRTASLDWMSRFHIMEGIAQGVLYLHTHELCIVHKDLKPSNILLDSNMNAKINDFGIAKMLLCPGSYDTRIVDGTLGYMAPEVVCGILSTKADVYAYGVILLEAISAKKPHGAYLQDDQLMTLPQHMV